MHFPHKQAFKGVRYVLGNQYWLSEYQFCTELQNRLIASGNILEANYLHRFWSPAAGRPSTTDPPWGWTCRTRAGLCTTWPSRANRPPGQTDTAAQRPRCAARQLAPPHARLATLLRPLQHKSNSFCTMRIG